MNLVDLYNKQVDLDTLISNRIKKVNPAFEMYSVENMDKKIFAFRVELSELANEVGFFKYWKHSHRMDRMKVLGEWADCFHFLLSIGIGHDWDDYVKEISSSVQPILDLDTSKHLFYALMVQTFTDSVAFAQALSLLITIGHTLGFTDSELHDAYLVKNEVNIKRQMEGY